MERVADLLGATLRRMKNSDAAQAWLNARWSALVGATMAKHIRPASCNQGLLCVEADSPEWKNQVGLMSRKLRERVNQDWGAVLVRELRVEMRRDSPKSRHEFDNDHLPFLRKRAKP